ncbi:MAG: ribbon-helix-helix domain-containing protein [Actinomycetota bacterium]
MTTVAIRLPDDILERLDELVRPDGYATRTEAIRRAIEVLLDAHEQAAIDREIVDAYTRMPQTAEEVAIAKAATKALVEEEPW